MSNIKLLLAPDAEHRRIFPGVPTVGFTRGKVLQICWLGQKSQWKETDGKSCGCQGKRCDVCTFSEVKNTFTSK